MGRVDHERLTRLLAAEELAWLLDRARGRMERGLALDATVSLSVATPAQRDALARLLGRRLSSARGLSVSLVDLDAVVRRSGAHDGGLAGAVETLTGPVVVRAEAANVQARAWAAAFAPLEEVAVARPVLEPWVVYLRSTGVVKRLAGGSPDAAAELLLAACRVIAALPCEPADSLAAFSARVLGRAHALDDGAPLGTLALGAARILSGLAPPEPDESPSEARREAWAAVGVLCDELSSMVLTLGLATDEASPGGKLLATARAAGEPVWLTLRQLVRAPPHWSGAARVSIVENPSVIALAADRLGPRCPPLVCTNGQPRAAAMVLLRSLTGAARLRHHGDFDWPGIAIGNLLHRRLGVEAWWFDTRAYVDAVALHRHTAPLAGAPVTARWDPQLSELMEATGRQIEEELVARALLEELGAGR